MAQGKVVSVGFRRYEVLNITATDTFPTEPAVFQAERIESVMIFSDVAVKVKFGSVTNGEITIPANYYVPFPIKAKQVWVKVASGAGPATVEIIGFQE